MNWITGVHLYELMPNYKVRSVRLMLISTWLLLLLSMPFPFLFEQINLEELEAYRWRSLPFIGLYLLVLTLIGYKKFLVAKLLMFLTGLMQLAAISLLLGKQSGVDYFFTLSMVFPFFIFDRDERGWLKISLLVFLVEIFLVQILMDNYQPVVELEPEVVDLIRTPIIILTILVILLPSYYFHGLAGESEEQAEEEKQASDKLLRNTLPTRIADELIANGFVKARLHRSVTVLFTDFVNFSSVAAQMNPRELIEVLDSCFSSFDRICQHYGVEKLKTIGDAYMCAAGIPEPVPDHAVRIIKAAIKMRGEIKRLMQKRLREGKPAWQVRIGVHSGPLIAGVIGRNRFAYDVWGNTVNVASRMETYGEAGRINISEATYQLIEHEFSCKNRGSRLVKGIGKTTMYFVTGWSSKT